MDIQSRKIIFVQEFLDLQNEAIITSLEKLMTKEKIKYAKNSVTPLSTEQLNNEIDLALKDSENDKVISASALKEKIKQWS